MTAIMPETIDHLDFDFNLETEEPHVCTLKRRRGQDHVQCGRLAEWVVTCAKPCGHVSETYLCNSCYERAIINAQLPYNWRCGDTDGGKTSCGYMFFPRDAVVSAVRI